jgi:hypothetical protein
MREFVLYAPRGGYSATADIARGSAIVGVPRAEAAEVDVYFEGAISARRTCARSPTAPRTRLGGWPSDTPPLRCESSRAMP